MLEEIFDSIEKEVNVKENLLKLKEAAKKEGSKLKLDNKKLALLGSLLKADDPKIRKNAALVLGETGQGSVSELLDVYEHEEIMYVRNAILTAVEQLDYKPYEERLATVLESLESAQTEPENIKHLIEEKKLLIAMTGTNRRHSFCGFDLENELILVTNRNFRELTAAELEGFPHKLFNAGVMVKTNHIKEAAKCRLYEEMFFVVPGVRNCSGQADEAAKQLIDGGLCEYVSSRHKGTFPFYFRLEVKSKQAEQNVKFVKQLAAKIEEKSELKLINSTDAYELEIRLVERTAGGYSVMLKLMNFNDMRFNYRKEVIASCLRPYNAALTMALAKPYLKEKASVLDPFCGVGTMLAERAFAGEQSVMYGIDIFGEAIEKAKKNVADLKFGTRWFFINKDFFEFKHEYTFDEIVTDMPFPTAHSTEREIERIYAGFFDKAYELLSPGGKIIMYTHNAGFVKRYANRGSYSILKEYEISKREKTSVFILEVLT